MYEAFARVYDRFMMNAPYDEWVSLLEKIWVEHGLIDDLKKIDTRDSKLILELGCGTGNVTKRLAEKGYDMIGIDSSPDMLAEAVEKSKSENTFSEDKNTDEDDGSIKMNEKKVNHRNNDILYLCQDMRSFELYGTVDGIICICDGINYLTKTSDVLKVFRLVKNYLNPGGIFIFDIITGYKYRKILAENSFSEANEDSAFIWDNYFDRETKINRYSVSFFIQNQEGLYERFDETHYQRAYGKNTMIRLLNDAGLELLGMYDESGSGEKPRSERLFFAARKNIFLGQE